MHHARQLETGGWEGDGFFGHRHGLRYGRTRHTEAVAGITLSERWRRRQGPFGLQSPCLQVGSSPSRDATFRSAIVGSRKELDPTYGYSLAPFGLPRPSSLQRA